MAEIFDVAVVGSGAAGLSAALKAADLGAHVAVLSATALLAGSSPRAQGGVAAAVGADDSAALHAADTLAVGAGLNDAGAVAILTREGGPAVRELAQVFEHDLGLEAGHGRRRILHAGGGATGSLLTGALLGRAAAHSRITLFPHAPVTSLVVDDGRVTGVQSTVRVVAARAVVLASGGYAALWGRTTNAPETRGDGLALAWRAGASLADLEFVQFHPTALDLPGRPAFLLSEALRGEGARLIDVDGNPIVDPLLPRDVVARAISRHLRQAADSHVFLSLQHLPPGPITARFERLAATLRTFGLDLARDRLPVAPAAHYCMGGIRTDTFGRTDVAGLYAAGEVACTGVQGANRLASNSLLECLVFGARAAEAALDDPAAHPPRWPTRSLPLQHVLAAEKAFNTRIVVSEKGLGRLLDDGAGVERDGPRLQALISKLPDPDHAARADVLVAGLVARAALWRTESRGAHFRTDAPQPDPAWRGRIHWRRASPPAFEEVLP